MLLALNQPSPDDGHVSSTRCSSCLAYASGLEGCQELMNDLMARAFEDIRYATVYNLAFDSYCMQHPGKYCVSAKSYAAHLMGLCHGLEHAGDPESYWSIPFWLDGPTPVELQKPPIVTLRGELTVAHVHGPMEPAEYARRVGEWARSVWGAYASQQTIARDWLHRAMAARRR